MSVLEVDGPTVMAVFRVVTVERFAVLVLAMGARMGRLLGANTAALLVTAFTHDRLTIVGNSLAIGLAFLLLHDLHWSHMKANTRWWTDEWLAVASEIRIRRTMASRSAARTGDWLVNHFRSKLPKEDVGR